MSILPVWQIKFVWTLYIDCAILYDNILFINVRKGSRCTVAWRVDLKIYAGYSSIVVGSISDGYAFS